MKTSNILAKKNNYVTLSMCNGDCDKLRDTLIALGGSNPNQWRFDSTNEAYYVGRDGKIWLEDETWLKDHGYKKLERV